jgi:hypothetical protein
MKQEDYKIVTCKFVEKTKTDDNQNVYTYRLSFNQSLVHTGRFAPIERVVGGFICLSTFLGADEVLTVNGKQTIFTYEMSITSELKPEHYSKIERGLNWYNFRERITDVWSAVMNRFSDIFKKTKTYVSSLI